MTIQEKIANDGFIVINNLFEDEVIEAMLSIISEADSSKPTFRKTNDLFAIRQFLKEVPDVVDPIFSERLCNLIIELFGNNFFIVKSIYFDKPETSNWFVSYHQDLTISVNRKVEMDGYTSWTVKQNQYAVQPPLYILQDNFIIRIHLDKTDEKNGALKVISGSHTKGIYRPETIDLTVEKEVSCPVEKGGIMIMKPLLLHSSGKTTNSNKRRVIHIEFSRCNLPHGLRWAEYMQIPELPDYSYEFKKQLDEDDEAYLKGEMKTFTWEQIKESISRDIDDKQFFNYP